MRANRLKNFIQQFHPRVKFMHAIRSVDRILELGCGSGMNYFKYREIGGTAQYAGVDILPPESWDKASLPFEYHCLNLEHERLPYPDWSFDAILFNHVIEHLHNPFHIAPEITRVLKPGGRIYIEAPNWISMLFPSFQRARRQFGVFNFFDDPTHIRPWTKFALYSYLEQKCGLRAEKTGTVVNWMQLPIDIIRFPLGMLLGARSQAIGGFWNLTGWAIYAIGVKTPDPGK